jgi:hypothetical protein
MSISMSEVSQQVRTMSDLRDETTEGRAVRYERWAAARSFCCFCNKTLLPPMVIL